MQFPIEILTDKLLKKGIRLSYQRIRVLDYLHRSESHPTVDEIFRGLSPEIPSLSKVTIYNTLHTFAEAGLVRIVGIDDAEMRYDIALSNHGHFLCVSCGAITDFSVDIDEISAVELNQFVITEKNLYFKGHCPDCLNKPVQRKKE